MRRKMIWASLMPAALLACTLGLAGCSGDDGSNGAAGLSAYDLAVANGTFSGTEQDWNLQQAGVQVESCSTCHNGTVVRSGASHQEAYAELFQQGVVTVSNIVYASAVADADGDGGVTPAVLSDVVTFTMQKNGADFNCEELVSGVGALNIGFSVYDPATRSFNGDAGSRVSIGGKIGDTTPTDAEGTITYLGGGVCQSVKAQSGLGDLNLLDGPLVVYGQDELVEQPEGTHISLAKYPFAGMFKIEASGGGTIDYVSDANVTGCEKCHQTPYYKHGYILADIGSGVGDLDFYTCKVCHIDDGAGHDWSWQIAVNDPQRWAEIFNGSAVTAAEQTQYAYKTRLMNDVHMSHMMEFPYPQSMRNCDTCHHGKLTETLATANMTLETCKSCHPVTGGTDTADANGNFAVDTTAIALDTLIPHAFDDTTVCADCHKVGGIAPLFSEIHTGYNPIVYDEASGTKYADAFTASIDSVTLANNVLDIKFSATEGIDIAGLTVADITPTVQVAFYGYDTKDFILSNHTRDANSNRIEFTIGSADNALFTNVATGVDGSWEVTLDLSAYSADPTIPEMIADGTIKKAEVAVLPALKNAAGDTVGLDAPSKTIDVTADAVDPFVDNYFQGTNALVNVAVTGNSGCNRCHDQLATTFHSGNRGGNIVVCRMCHVVTSGGSHLEGQSRSIDSYVHAIHRFQAFNVDSIDFTDAVEKAKYEEEIEFLFPDFATINCEACHTNSRAVDNGSRLAYDVPDQSKSMPGLLSGTDEISGVIPATTPAVIVGPAARACGACHRAEDLNEDGAGEYASLNQHMKLFGYRVEDSTGMLDAVISYIMGMFQ